jgi:16S rRNA C967 or C1407 C5-methylase (RsmB/RsmF family)
MPSHLINTDAAPEGSALPLTGVSLRLFPHLHQTDGFFAAAFERRR